MRTLSLAHARRIALTAMGLARRRPDPHVRRDVRHFRRVLDHVDIVQIDSVNVLARAHELPFWSRLGPHDRAARDRWLWRSREVFECWSHVACMTSVDVWPLLAWRREREKPWGHVLTLQQEEPEYIASVRDEVERHGPRSVRSLSDPGERNGPWWGMPKGRVALDYLWVRGELAVDHRTGGFMTVYDLTERVVPEQVLQLEPPPAREARKQLLLRSARAHGIGTADDLADHHRLGMQRAKPLLDELVDEGQLERVRVRGWGELPVYKHPQAGAARHLHARTLLSPFDPMVWYRDRAERLFDFHYRIEIYVPEAKRVYGYYVLPFLLGDDIVARVDLKADRKASALLVKGAFLEDGADAAVVARELADELHDLASWLELEDVVVSDHGDLAPKLARCV